MTTGHWKLALLRQTVNRGLNVLFCRDLRSHFGLHCRCCTQVLLCCSRSSDWSNFTLFPQNSGPFRVSPGREGQSNPLCLRTLHGGVQSSSTCHGCLSLSSALPTPKGSSSSKRPNNREQPLLTGTGALDSSPSGSENKEPAPPPSPSPSAWACFSSRCHMRGIPTSGAHGAD